MRGDLLAVGLVGLAAVAGARPRGGAAVRRVVKTLPAGTIVYHGTASEAEFTSLRGPAWVTTRRAVAQWFASEWHGYGRRRILRFRLRAPVRLQLIPDLDTLELVSENLGVWGGSEEISSAFCARGGVHGWIVPDNYGPMQDDILLCDTSVLELLDIEPLEG